MTAEKSTTADAPLLTPEAHVISASHITPPLLPPKLVAMLSESTKVAIPTPVFSGGKLAQIDLNASDATLPPSPHRGRGRPRKYGPIESDRVLSVPMLAVHQISRSFRMNSAEAAIAYANGNYHNEELHNQIIALIKHVRTFPPLSYLPGSPLPRSCLRNSGLQHWKQPTQPLPTSFPTADRPACQRR